MFLCSSRSFFSWMTIASRPSTVLSRDLDLSAELPASDSASLWGAVKIQVKKLKNLPSLPPHEYSVKGLLHTFVDLAHDFFPFFARAEINWQREGIKVRCRPPNPPRIQSVRSSKAIFYSLVSPTEHKKFKYLQHPIALSSTVSTRPCL